eukprot:3120652-Alexandrium_andersonii.AAC.1
MDQNLGVVHNSSARAGTSRKLWSAPIPWGAGGSSPQGSAATPRRLALPDFPKNSSARALNACTAP